VLLLLLCLAFDAADTLACNRCHFMTCICRCMLPANRISPCPAQPLPCLPAHARLCSAAVRRFYIDSCGFDHPQLWASTGGPRIDILPFFKPLAA